MRPTDAEGEVEAREAGVDDLEVSELDEVGEAGVSGDDFLVDLEDDLLLLLF